jgi:UDP-glucose 4-epimerase
LNSTGIEGALGKRVLITGGNGYVGRTLSRKLSFDHDVTVVDCLRQGTLRFSDDDLAAIKLEQVDIRDAVAIGAVFESVQPDLVIHAAALHYIPECDAYPDEAISINVLGTANVARYCPPGARLVFISTAAVYAPKDQPHVEDESPIGPMDVYGWTKLHAEHYVRHWSAKRDLRTAIIRLFNVVGPGETNPHLLPAIMSQVLEGQRTLSLGNCHPKRDYIDVEDVADAIRAVAEGLDDAQGVDVVNVGTGESYSVYEVLEQLSEVIGEELTVETDPARLRAVDRPVLWANIDKANLKYGWTPKLRLSDSLRSLWATPDISQELLARS